MISSIRSPFTPTITSSARLATMDFSRSSFACSSASALRRPYSTLALYCSRVHTGVRSYRSGVPRPAGAMTLPETAVWP